MEKRKINASELVSDVRNGYSNDDLMIKYQISLDSLNILFEKLISAGIFKQYELSGRTPLPIKNTCPACDAERPENLEECPRCGIIYSKARAKKQKPPSSPPPIIQPDSIDNFTNKNPNMEKCSVCCKLISKTAEICPHCGENRGNTDKLIPITIDTGSTKINKTNKAIVIISVLISSAVIIYSAHNAEKNRKTIAQSSPPPKINQSNTSNTKPISETKERKQPKIKTEQELRKERIERGFSPWDGSHRQLEKIVKKAMNDPDSYKHDQTTYIDKGDYLIVNTTFRGKNKFGGVVRNRVSAKATLDGDVIEIISQGP